MDDGQKKWGLSALLLNSVLIFPVSRVSSLTRYASLIICFQEHTKAKKDTKFVIMVTFEMLNQFYSNWGRAFHLQIFWINLLIKYVAPEVHVQGHTKAKHAKLLITITSGILNQFKPS